MSVAILHGSNDTYGATRVLCQEVSCLVDLGHEVVILVPSDGPLVEELARAGVSTSSGHRVRVVVDPQLSVLRRSKPSDVLHPIRLHPDVAKADLVILWTLALAAYIPVLRLNRKKFYVSVHELLLGRTGGLLVRMLLAPGRFPICACSQASADWLVQNGVNRARVSITWPVFAPLDEIPSRPPHDPITLAVVGRVNGHKGHLEVVRALQSLSAGAPKWRLFLFGAPFPGQESAVNEIEQAIAGDVRIEYRGEAASVASIAAQIDAVACFPTTPEPFGLVPIEAWREGVRSVGFADGGASEVLPNVGGISVQRTAAPILDIAAALLTLADSIGRGEDLPSPKTVNPLFSKARRLTLIGNVIKQCSADPLHDRTAP